MENESILEWPIITIKMQYLWRKSDFKLGFIRLYKILNNGFTSTINKQYLKYWEAELMSVVLSGLWNTSQMAPRYNS